MRKPPRRQLKHDRARVQTPDKKAVQTTIVLGFRSRVLVVVMIVYRDRVARLGVGTLGPHDRVWGKGYRAIAIQDSRLGNWGHIYRIHSDMG